MADAGKQNSVNQVLFSEVSFKFYRLIFTYVITAVVNSFLVTVVFNDFY